MNRPGNLGRIFCALGVFSFAMVWGATAADKPVKVLELFTSQGCSSCPPADALFREYSKNPDIVALAYHVDYWDYLGWRDDLASTENTQHQQAYAEVFGGSVYTPQLVINGSRHVIGSERATIEDEVGSASGSITSPVAVDLLTSDNSVRIHVGSGPKMEEEVHVVLVFYQPRRLVEIVNGQNAGRTVDYRNIVTSRQTVGIWHGQSMDIEIPRSEMEKKGGGCAVLLQQMDEQGYPGAIVGAGQTPRNAL